MANQLETTFLRLLPLDKVALVKEQRVLEVHLLTRSLREGTEEAIDSRISSQVVEPMKGQIVGPCLHHRLTLPKAEHRTTRLSRDRAKEDKI